MNQSLPCTRKKLWEIFTGGSPLSTQHQLMPLKTFSCAHFILNEANHISHAAHRQIGMSAALDTVTNLLYFAQEARLRMLKCHPLKVSSKYTEPSRNTDSGAECSAHRTRKPYRGFSLLYQGQVQVDRASLHLALWRGKQSLQTFLLETRPETEKRKGGPKEPVLLQPSPSIKENSVPAACLSAPQIVPLPGASSPFRLPIHSKSVGKSLNEFRDHMLQPLLPVHQRPLQSAPPPLRLFGVPLSLNTSALWHSLMVLITFCLVLELIMYRFFTPITGPV